MFESIAYAAAPGTAQASPLVSFVPLILLIVIFYFLLIRPQQKRQKEHEKMVQNLKKGDRVVTSGGVIGRIAGLQDDYVVLKTDESDHKMEVLKSAITGLRESK
jgi:preprotein translocase subunit YajC